MTKISNVLLIDDDYPTNYLHKIYITESELVENIHAKSTADEGLEYLRDENSPIPEFIFIDINLPAKSGFDFVEEFGELRQEIIDNSKLIMCSTSDSPRDINKSKEYPLIRQIIVKPLTTEKFIEIVKTYA